MEVLQCTASVTSYRALELEQSTSSRGARVIFIGVNERVHTYLLHMKVCKLKGLIDSSGSANRDSNKMTLSSISSSPSAADGALYQHQQFPQSNTRPVLWNELQQFQKTEIKLSKQK